MMQLQTEDSFPRVPAVTAAYEVGSKLAQGGFGAVYQARQRNTGQSVAIKTLRLDQVDSETAVARFRREMQLGALLQHPNIVRLIDSGEAPGGMVFAVFEFVRGSDLADVLAAEAALGPAETVHLMAQVLDALACAHGHGVVHRDLKPANIMITQTGARRNAMVMDFGLGTLVTDSQWPGMQRLTLREEYLGTPAYSAPEQLRCEPAVTASDLFAWGLIFVECLQGRPVCDGPTPLIFHQQLSPEAVALPPALADHPLGVLLSGVLEKAVELRPTSAIEVLDRLLEIQEPLPPREDLSRPAPTPAAPSLVGSRARIELSRVWSVPVRRNPNFTGRNDLLEQVHTMLEGGESLVALRGLGGVGKTQLGVEFAYRFGNAYDVVAWLHAGDPESLADDFASLAESLELPEKDSPDHRRKIEAVRRWLERRPDWLLIFDNAPNPDAIRAFLPRSTSGHIVVTSRHPSWRDLGKSVEVEELPLPEATEFLIQRTGDDDREASGELATQLGQLPLALEEAAAYIEATGRSIRDYLALLHDQQDILLERVDASTSGSESLRTTWEIAFRQVEEEEPDAADLLRLCAFLGPDGIPFELLQQGGEQLPEQLAQALSDPRRFDRCVAALRRYSLVKIEQSALTLHRMVQLATRARLDGEARDEWAARALRVTEAGFPRSGLAGDYQPNAGRFLPHALATIEHGRKLPSCAFEVGRLLNRTGNYLSARGSHDEACQHLEHSAAVLRDLPKPPEGLVAGVYADLSLVRFALGSLDLAREHAERALEIHERVRGPEHFRVALDLIGLTFVLHAQGELERARECSSRAVSIVEHIFDAKHAMVAMALSLLGRAQWGLGEIAAARASTERGIDVLIEQPLYHPLLCSAWLNLARVQIDVGALDQAAVCAERSLEIGLRAYGDDHPLVAVGRLWRGTIQDYRGEAEAACAEFECALASGERSSTYLKEDEAIARAQLGDLRRRMGDPAGARERLEHALHVMDRIAGSKARLACYVESALAALRIEEGEPGAGLEHAERALTALDALYGPDHPLRVPSLNLLARAEWDLGMAPRARRAAEQALEIGEAASPDHPDLAETHRLLAALSPDGPDGSTHSERALALAPTHLHPAPLCLRPSLETR